MLFSPFFFFISRETRSRGFSDGKIGDSLSRAILRSARVGSGVVFLGESKSVMKSANKEDKPEYAPFARETERERESNVFLISSKLTGEPKGKSN